MPNKSVRSAVAVIAALMASACGSGAPRAQQPPPLGPIAAITSTSQIARPIDVYVPTLAEDEQLIQARDAVVAQCMRGFGLSFNVPGLKGLDNVAASYKSRTRVYGYFNDGASPARGYDNLVRGMDASGKSPQSEEAIGVLDGKDENHKPVTQHNGKPVPVGGCLRVGIDAIGGDVPRTDAAALPGGAPDVPITDPRLVSVYAAWSTCMKGKGFTYSDPAAAFLDPKWAPPAGAEFSTYSPSPAEIATATSDLDCKRSTNLVGIAVAVETAYDKRYIESHAAALADFRSKMASRLKNAAQIIAAHRGTAS